MKLSYPTVDLLRGDSLSSWLYRLSHRKTRKNRPHNRARLEFEPLERRALLSVAVDLQGFDCYATDSAQWGQSISVQSQIKNAGTSMSGVFQVAWYLSQDSTGSSDDILLSRTNGAGYYSHARIAGNSVGSDFTVNLQLPSVMPSAWSSVVYDSYDGWNLRSKFFVIQKTDSASQVIESKENNNFGQIGNSRDRDSITITIPTVDLQGFDCYATDIARWGQSISVQSQVKNAGTGASGAFQVAWYLSKDGTGSSDDILLSRTNGAGRYYSHAGIAGNSVGSDFTVNLQLPSVMPLGWKGTRFFVIQKTDSASQVPDYNCNNNFGQIGINHDFDLITIYNQVLTSVLMTPNTVTINTRATQQFVATARDQFGYDMIVQPAFVWSTTVGSISASGLFTASNQPTTATITARTGVKSASAVVTVTAVRDKELAALFQTLFVDGSISRNDMIQLLRLSGNDDGTVDTIELTDLKSILANASTYKMADYVQVLVSNVVNGNLANATFGGKSLGNLVAGSLGVQINTLVDKWFLGTDRPLTDYTYQRFAGSLFVNGPSSNDSNQGGLGDCYFIASMDALAKSSPTAIQNMFVDNGDNTWTVRFYVNGVADFVTVDRYLPTYGSSTIYASTLGCFTNSGNELWMPLVEKAYAQWNETGNEGRDGRNSYASINGGWMQTVCQQVLGKPSQTFWWLPDSDKQFLIAAMNSNKAVTYATASNGDGLVGGHAYMVSSYNATTGTFQLYNPWGGGHPGALTYAQLRTNGQCFVIADPSGSVPVVTAKPRGVAIATATGTLVGIYPEYSDTCSVAVLPQIEVVANPVVPQARSVTTDGVLAHTFSEPINESIRFLVASGSRAKTWSSLHSAVEQSFEDYDALDIDPCSIQFVDLVHRVQRIHA
jgi:hypothetical protein